MYYSSADKRILLDLFKKQNSIQLYFFYKEYKLSPAQLSRFVRIFNEIGVISIQDDFIKLTEFGKKWMIKYRKDIFLKPKEKSWRTVPSEWLKIQK
jgi:hypothetical protein